MHTQMLLPLSDSVESSSLASLHSELTAFSEFGTQTLVQSTKVCIGGMELNVPTYVNEFWTSKQRAAHSLHEISYRACFKPQLPRFFIQRLTKPGDVVLDPFMGRGTTLLEAALMGRIPQGNDANPLASVLASPRLVSISPETFVERLETLVLPKPREIWQELDVFYHKKTLSELCALRQYFIERERMGDMDDVDRFIRMVTINRLTGHSPGFLSVYSLPPNQAVSIQSQRKINEKRQQVPTYRDFRKIVRKKGLNLLQDVTKEETANLQQYGSKNQLTTGQAQSLKDFKDNTVDLVVTSPPFLDVVQYATDNWLRCWFIGQDAKALNLTVPSKLPAWKQAMQESLVEMNRVCKRGAHVAFEIGEVKLGQIQLEDAVIPQGLAAGFTVELVMINAQEFTKTSHCWGVENQKGGTNTNRIVLFKKP